MKNVKKILIASAMVVTLGGVISCKSEQPHVYTTGIPYTIIGADFNGFTGEYTIKLDYTGSDVEIYWNSTTPSTDKEFTFNIKEKESEPVFIVLKGNVNSIWFCDNNGNPLAEGNRHILAIIFSNKIKSIPNHACYALPLQELYIPRSVSEVGEYAFAPYNPTEYYCEHASRPNGWNKKWCSQEIDRLVTWGIACYVADNDLAYLVDFNNKNKEVSFFGSLLVTGVTDVVVPESVNIDGETYKVTSIASLTNIKYTVKNITLPGTISYLHDIFSNNYNIETITFNNSSKFLVLAWGTFYYCVNTKSIVLPEGLLNIPEQCFENCDNLPSIKIPKTVQFLDEKVFWSVYDEGAKSDKPFVIDLTGFNEGDNIPLCSEATFDGADMSVPVVIKIKSETLKNQFIAKGWTQGRKPDEGKKGISWEVPTTSLA